MEQARTFSPEDLHIPGPRNADGASISSEKNRSRIDPLATPDFYARHFDGHENQIPVAYTNGDSKTFDFLKRIDDPETSFSASVFINKEDGHAVILYKGTDLPGRDEGSGRTGFVGDLKAINQARRGEVNDQTAPAEKVYLDMIDDPSVKSVEIIGYSIGSQHLNYMAAKHGAHGIAIADMGIPDSVLTSVFNRGIMGGGAKHALFGINKEQMTDPEVGRPISEFEINKQMTERVTVLGMRMDVLPKWFAAGPSRGAVISLDEGNILDLKGLVHVPQAYAANAAKRQEPTPPAPAP